MSLRQLFQQSGAAAQNLGWIVTERLLRLASNVAVSFLVARHLGPEQFGLLSYALAFVSLGLAAAEAGVEGVVKREIVRAPERAAAVLVRAWRIRLAAGAAAYAAVLVWSTFGEPVPAARVVLVVAGLVLFQPALAVSDLWLQATLQARLATRAQLAGIVTGSAIRLGLIVADAPLWGYAAAAVVEAALTAFLLRHFAASHGLRGGGAIVSALSARQIWAESWPLLFSALTVAVYLRIDVVMLRYMIGEGEVGTYAAAVRLSELASFLPAAIAASWLPGLIRAKNAGPTEYADALQRYFDLSAALSYAIVLPTVLLAPLLVALAYGAAFAAAAPVLAIHGWTLIWAALGVARGQYCINEGLTRFHLAATGAGAVSNVLLNLWLIPRHGAVGAAWATFIAQGIAAWGSSFCYAPVRACAALQTRALLIPIRGWRYIRATSA